MYNMNTNSSTENTATKISIKKKYDDHYSYYVDVNGLLKGEWGGYKELETKGPNGELMYELYYTRTFENNYPSPPVAHSKWIIVNERGYFYNKFSCKKYDAVEDVGWGYYRCEKNGRYGIINEEEQEILHTCYNQIWESSKQPVFFVQCETGWFIYNVDQQKQSKVYEEIQAINRSYIRFKEGEGYGLMNYIGEVIIQPKFEKIPVLNPYDNHLLAVDFKGARYGIEIKDNLFYGKVSPCEYDFCFEVNYYNFIGSEFYVTKRREKYGILNNRFDCVSEPVLDDIILASKTNHRRVDMHYIFIIGKQGDSYKLFNMVDKACIIDDCSHIAYSQEETQGISGIKGFNYYYIVFRKDGRLGYVTYKGAVIGCKYDTIEPFYGFFLVSKDKQFGLLLESGELFKPCEYDGIKYDYGEVVFIKDGEEIDRISNAKVTNTYSSYEPQHYSRYAGSYAQDEMGYSDEDIDTIFDGDPLAYWNID